MQKKKLQWHPAFYSALRLELAEDSEALEFHDEFQLANKPLQIDCVVQWTRQERRIKNEIGHIFRTYNLFEYKSPKDALSIDNFYKTIAYAYLYKVSSMHVNEISMEEITITLIRDRKPVKLFSELMREGYTYKERFPGIYYVEGERFPIQIIVSSLLNEETHLQLKALTDHMDENLFRNYVTKMNELSQREKDLADIVLQVIMGGNYEMMEKWKERDPIMCEALRLLMKDEIEEEMQKRGEEGMKQGRRTERIVAIQNMIRYEVPEEKILQDYSKEEYDAAKNALMA